MSEHPIIFTGEMVRAILEERKTQTRRVITHLYDGAWCLDPDDNDEDKQRLVEACLYGKPGDTLWVRETWWQETPLAVEGRKHWLVGYDATPECYKRVPFGIENWQKATYHTDANAALARQEWESFVQWKKKPSIHLPRWASRITLEVVKVRVERVQDISYEDAEAEGAPIDGGTLVKNHRLGFARLWDSINAKRGYGWDANPYVWVIQFQLAQKGIPSIK